MDAMRNTFELLHDSSLPSIELLQRSFPDNKDFMINISTLFDPRYVFLIYAPILFAFNKKVGHRMIAALTLTEWANQILKWLLAGERPYWYANERAQEIAQAANLTVANSGIDSYDSALLLSETNSLVQQQIPQLKQFPVTCELGAGSPSGHAMVTATVWYILIDACLKGELPIFRRVNYANIEQASHPIETRLAKISWSIYAVMILMVSLSRVYLACHFPHQCVCGAIFGILVARFVVEKLPLDKMNPRHFCATTAFMFISALGTYAILRSLGANPLWSVDKGMRWCVKKEYIHLDTTPFFSMMRYLGFCLGAGLAYKAKETLAKQPAIKLLPEDGHLLFARRLLVSLASVLFGQMLLSLPMPKANLNVFYVISFASYVIFSYAIAAPIPRLVKQVFHADVERHHLSNKLM